MSAEGVRRVVLVSLREIRCVLSNDVESQIIMIVLCCFFIDGFCLAVQTADLRFGTPLK